MKKITPALAALLIGIGGGYLCAGPIAAYADPARPALTGEKTLAGDFLSSIFAQRQHDWKKAGEYLSDVMRATPDDPALQKRAMALAMGAGDPEGAIVLAKKLSNDPDSAALAHLFLAVGELRDKHYKDAADNINAMPQSGLSDFIMPLLQAWTKAGLGQMDVSELDKNTIHVHHAALIADFLHKDENKDAHIGDMLDKLMAADKVEPEDMERAANLYAHMGQNDKALKLYEKIAAQWPDDPDTLKKMDVLKSGRRLETMEPVSSAEDGVANALYDMANLLFRENADDSARVFAQMAIYLEPKDMEPRLLLAAVDARAERYADAIASYKMAPQTSEYYVAAQQHAAELMEDSGDVKGAVATLQSLASRGDVDSLIRVGDVYRRQDDFAKAIEIYNAAARIVGSADGKIPRQYWNLLYVRGMSYDRAGQWDKAEADLKAALSYQPDHPFILNYLGYAWADRGENLDQAFEMVKKAALLQPSDGYIADSVGWVLYKSGRYDEAATGLEKAVELLPYDPTINDHLGDVYWQMGRKREARFQWQRAGNYTDDKAFAAKVALKVAEGLPPAATSDVKEAHSATAAAGTETVIH